MQAGARESSSAERPAGRDAPCRSAVVWDEQYLAYDFGDHPMHPARLDRTVRLARELGVLDRVDVQRPDPARESDLLTAHTGDYLAALRRASAEPDFVGFGLGTSDDPVFAGMYEVAALIAGGSLQAARAVWSGRVEHGVNIAGGRPPPQPRAPPRGGRGHPRGGGHRWLLAHGARRVAYVDVDVHHGDGVQAAFYDDPRVLTVSLHQHPATLFPGTGHPREVGTGAGAGTSVNVALPPGTTDDQWLQAFSAVVPSVVRAFEPDVLVSQSGCDTHHEDPLAQLELTVDGQRAAFALVHELAHSAAGGRWVVLGGGGYGVLRCVPRTWTHLLAETSGVRIDPATAIPDSWVRAVRARGETGAVPETMGEGRPPAPRPWDPGGDSWLERSVAATRSAVFPHFGLDPHDPRD